MRTVEFRLLQVILSPVSGDRVTLALLHWDGEGLRIASSAAGLSAVAAERREGIRVAVEDLVREAHRVAERIAREPLLNVGLSNVYPVREGMGAALYWSPVTRSKTADAEAHFANLRDELRLTHAPLVRTKRVTGKALFRKLSAIGETLRLEGLDPARIRTDFSLVHRMTYQPPLSWMNGAWHHAVPFSLDGLDHEQMDREVQRAFGLVELAFPNQHVPVIVAALPYGTDSAASDARAEADLLRHSLRADHRVVMVFASREDEGLGFGELVVRIKKDVAAASS